jgi:diguanylate cyclase (GGDEF)-like protein
MLSVASTSVVSPMFAHYSPDIKKQALQDLAIRARGGIVIYLAVWLITAAWFDILSISPVLFWVNTAIMAFLALARLLHYRLVFKQSEANIDFLTNSLVFLILANGLHTGVLGTWIIAHPEYAKLHYPTMIILAAFALGGTVTLSISRTVRIFYPVFIYGPPVAVLLLMKYNSDYFFLATLALFSLVYVIDAARLTSRDYWKAIKSNMIAEQRAKQLEQLSITDPLTRLKNRMYFNTRYREEWKRCHRLGIKLSVLMIDLDNFKRINDTYGHLFGDECLREISATLQRQIPRETDVIARYGGEEFIVLLPGTELDDAERIAARLVKATAETEVKYDDQSISLTSSIGVACTRPDHQNEEESLLRAADHALYAAKANGRNQWASSS